MSRTLFSWISEGSVVVYHEDFRYKRRPSGTRRTTRMRLRLLRRRNIDLGGLPPIACAHPKVICLRKTDTKQKLTNGRRRQRLRFGFHIHGAWSCQSCRSFQLTPNALRMSLGPHLQVLPSITITEKLGTVREIGRQSRYGWLGHTHFGDTICMFHYATQDSSATG